MIRKERIGWSVAGRHYRVRSPVLALATRLVDLAGAVVFCFIRRKHVPAPRRILVIQVDHIGDTVLAAPLVKNLRACYPDSRISMLVREMSRPIAGMIEELDDVVCLNTPWLSRRESTGWLAAAAFARSHFQRYDLAFELHGDPRNIMLARLAARFCVGSGIRGMGFLLNRDVRWQRDYHTHIIGLHARMLEAAGATPPKPAPAAPAVPEDALARARDLLKERGVREGTYALLQMSAGLALKEWPMEQWLDLAARLAARMPLVTADLDREKAALLSGTASRRPVVSVRAGLREYSALVTMSASVISVDTFTVHLAAAFRIPLVALYSGVNLASEWGPFGAQAAVLQDTTCPYYPCGLKKCVYGRPSPCMQRLRADTVFAKVPQ
ncbi:MAG: hypothetical protein GF418_04770 [Chitinivibrionales bacterium]|nr:hypothetical protein [Chitinivibrionales bacterium]MBD3394922.1 hypothetical protein [Chitinivibrionales bacterium]